MTVRLGGTLLPLIGAVLVVGGAVFGAIKLLDVRATEAAPEPPRASAPKAESTPRRVAPVERPATPADRGAIYRCQKDGKTLYSDTPCPGAASQVVDVRPTSGFLPPQRAVRAPRTVPALPTPEQPAAAAAATPTQNRTRCELIEKQIAAIDAEARQPLSIPRQDYLRQRRKALVDERNALDCHLVNK